MFEAEASEPSDRGLVIAVRIAAVDEQADAKRVIKVDAWQLERGARTSSKLPVVSAR